MAYIVAPLTALALVVLALAPMVRTLLAQLHGVF